MLAAYVLYSQNCCLIFTKLSIRNWSLIKNEASETGRQSFLANWLRWWKHAHARTHAHTHARTHAHSYSHALHSQSHPFKLMHFERQVCRNHPHDMGSSSWFSLEWKFQNYFPQFQMLSPWNPCLPSSSCIFSSYSIFWVKVFYLLQCVWDIIAFVFKFYMLFTHSLVA